MSTLSSKTSRRFFAYTLIELLVSMMVFMILFILLMTFFSSMLGLSSREITKAQALYDANAVLGQVRDDLQNCVIKDYGAPTVVVSASLSPALTCGDLATHLFLNSTGTKSSLRFFAFVSNNIGGNSSHRLMAMSYQLDSSTYTLTRYCRPLEGSELFPGNVNFTSDVEVSTYGTVMATGVTDFDVMIHQEIGDVVTSDASAATATVLGFSDAPELMAYPFGMTIRLGISEDSRTAHSTLRGRHKRTSQIFFTFPPYFDQFSDEAYK